MCTPRQVCSAPQGKKPLTYSQRSGVLASVNAHSFWWSKSSAVTQATVPPPARDPPLDNAASGGHAETELLPASTNAEHAFLTPDILPDEASIASEASAVTNAIPPLQYGDLADLGLTSFWTPAGWVRYSFEVLHVTTGMPWFYVIVAGSMLWRLVATKLTIVSTRNASLLRPYASEMRALDDRAKNADQAGKMEAMLQKKKIFDKTGANMLASVGRAWDRLSCSWGCSLV